MEQSMMTATDAPLKRLCSSSATQSCCNGIPATRHPPPAPPTRHATRCHLMLRVWHGEAFKFCILTYTHLLLCCVLCTVLYASCCMPHAACLMLADSSLSYSCCNAQLGNVSTMKTPTAGGAC